jgi:hypothetical protein
MWTGKLKFVSYVNQANPALKRALPRCAAPRPLVLLSTLHFKGGHTCLCLNIDP